MNTKKRLAVTALLLAAVTVLCMGVFAITSGTLFASGTDVNGRLVTDTRTKTFTVSLLDRLTMETVAETETKGGEYTLKAPEEGFYTLRVDAEGYLPVIFETVEVSAEGMLPEVSVKGFGGDINSDNAVDPQDLTLLKADYNKTKALGFAASDLNSDGKVDTEDLAILLDGMGKSTSDTRFDGVRFYNEAAYISPSSVAVIDATHIAVGDTTRNAVYKLDTSSGSVEDTYVASGKVSDVYVSDGKVYVAEGELEGIVSVLDASTFEETASVEVGHTPTAVIKSGDKLYVANRFSNTVSVIDASLEVIAEIEVTREPMALATDSGKLYAVHHITDDAATADVVSAKVSVMDMASNSLIKTVPIINGSSGVKDVVSDGNGRLYITHVLGRYAYPTTQIDRGWINTNAVTVFDCYSDSPLTTVLLDRTDLGAANPWGIDITDDGRKLAVALSGVHEVEIIDIPTLNAKLDAAMTSGEFESIPNSLNFLDGARERIALPGEGARALTAIGNDIYIGEYFTGDVVKLSLDTGKTSAFSLGAQPEMTEVRRGEMVWSDATLCYQKWQSCNSCHPDARVDGLNWDNLNDGIGTHKSAKSMLYSHRTPPVMVTGIRPNAEAAVRAGMKFIQFNVLPEEDMAAMDEYLKSLSPVASPYLNRNGTLTASALEGKALFETSGCISCHPAPLYTDMKLHATDIIDPDTDGWESRPFDTATLVEVWRSGPYRFNGKFATIRESVVHDTAGQELTDAEIDKLTEYVLSIGADNEDYGIEQVIGTSSEGETLYSKLVPGEKLTRFTLRKQDEFAREASVKVILEDAEGMVITKKSFDAPAMALGECVSFTLPAGFALPSNASGGESLKFIITDKRTGKQIASVLEINY